MSRSSSPLGNAPLGARRFTGVELLICTIAAIGFAFDTFELLVLPLIGRDALGSFGIQPNMAAFKHWLLLLFYVPAVAGGIFGLLGGYLTDRFGRRRVLTWSILLYAVSALLAGNAHSAPMFLVYRTTTYIGVCVEFVAAIAWLAELFEEPAMREKAIGITQAFGSLGGVMAAFANSIASGMNHEMAWRYTLMAGLIPAIPLILIRPFLPESPVWREKKAAGTLRRPSIGELFSPALRRTTVVTTIMFACTMGAAFGAIQQMPFIVGGAPEVQAEIHKAVSALPPPKTPASPAVRSMAKAVSATTMASAAPGVRTPAAREAAALPPNPRAKIVSATILRENADATSKIQEYGGLVGRILLVAIVLLVVSRRWQIRLFQIPGLIVLPVVFFYAATHSLTELKIGMFFVGLFTIAQISFWGNYLPHVFPLHLRGTGESFSANVGGRMIGTGFAGVTLLVAGWLTPEHASPVAAAHIWAYVAGGVGTAVYLVGLLMSFLLPEPPRDVLPT